MLGWFPEVAWHTPIDEISAAYGRKVKWQNAISGVAEKEPKGGPMTAEKRKKVASGLMAFAHVHNKKFAAKKAAGK
jgi:hypothetical protein